jgi:hypothetical protein
MSVDNPVLYLKLDKIEDGKVMDSSDSSIDGILAGDNRRTVPDERFGSCLYFEGNGTTEVKFGNPVALQITGSQTISLWVKPQDFTRRYDIFRKSAQGEGAITQEMDGRISYYYGGAAAQEGGYQTFQTEYKLRLHQWTHIALVRDLEAQKLYWYINGIKDVEADARYPAAKPTPHEAMIGPWYPGLMAHFYIYNQALSVGEVKQNMNAYQLGNLQLYYKLDRIEENDRIPDRSGWSRTGQAEVLSIGYDNSMGRSALYNSPFSLVRSGLAKLHHDFTLSAWFYITKMEEGPTFMILSKPMAADISGVTEHKSEFSLSVLCTSNDRGKLVFSMGTGDDYGLRFPQPGAPSDPEEAIEKNKWYFVAVTMQAGKASIYLNSAGLRLPHLRKIGEAEFAASKSRQYGDQPLLIGHEFHPGMPGWEGKLANVRVYDRALSAHEITHEIIHDDLLDRPAFLATHPVAFTLSDDHDRHLMYIDDDTTRDNQIKIGLHNVSGRTICFLNGGSAAASAENHHFELRFQPGTLAANTVDRLRAAAPAHKAEVFVEENAGWDVAFMGQTGARRYESLFFLYNGSERNLEVDELRHLHLRHINASPTGGARNTNIELRTSLLAYAEDAGQTPIVGYQSQSLHIVNHSGSEQAPLHVGFLGSNTILNDGEVHEGNNLSIRVTNIAKPETNQQPPVIRLNKDAAGGANPYDTRFIITFDIQYDDNNLMEWALGTQNDLEEINIKVTGIGNEQIDEPFRKEEVGETLIWTYTVNKNYDLAAGEHIRIDISGIKTSHPNGPTNLYFQYENIPGYWDGQVVCEIEKNQLTQWSSSPLKINHKYAYGISIGDTIPAFGAKLTIVGAAGQDGLSIINANNKEEGLVARMIIESESKRYGALTALGSIPSVNPGGPTHLFIPLQIHGNPLLLNAVPHPVSGIGKVGIGTDSPNYFLSLGIEEKARKLAVVDGGTNNFYGFGAKSEKLQFHVGTATDNDAQMTLDKAGKLAIKGDLDVGGKVKSQSGLDIRGNVSINGSLSIQGEVDGNNLILTGLLKIKGNHADCRIETQRVKPDEWQQTNDKKAWFTQVRQGEIQPYFFSASIKKDGFWETEPKVKSFKYNSSYVIYWNDKNRPATDIKWMSIVGNL